MPVVVGSAFAVGTFSLSLGSMLLGPTPFGRFFGFDFPAEFFVFGVFDFAAFAFLFCFGGVGAAFFCIPFFLVGFSFVVDGVGNEGTGGGSGQGQRPRRGGCSE